MPQKVREMIGVLVQMLVVPLVVMAVVLRLEGVSVPGWVVGAAVLFVWWGWELVGIMKESSEATHKQLVDVMYILDPTGTVREEAGSARMGEKIMWAKSWAEELKKENTRSARRKLASALRDLKETDGRGLTFSARDGRIYVEPGDIEVYGYVCEDCSLVFDEKLTLAGHRERLHGSGPGT